MGLTDNAIRIYLGTNMGELAKEAEDFEQFNSQWAAKVFLLSMSKDESDIKTYNAMKSVKAIEFYYDAISHD